MTAYKAMTTHMPDNGMQMETAAILAQIGSPGQSAMRIIDARAPERYDGSAETIDPVGGHIPGALNRFWKSNLGADGRFKKADQLRAELTTMLNGLRPASITIIPKRMRPSINSCMNR